MYSSVCSTFWILKSKLSILNNITQFFYSTLYTFPKIVIISGHIVLPLWHTCHYEFLPVLSTFLCGCSNKHHANCLTYASVQSHLCLLSQKTLAAWPFKSASNYPNLAKASFFSTQALILEKETTHQSYRWCL